MNLESLKTLMGLQGKPKVNAAAKIIQKFFFMHPGDGKLFTRGIMVKHIIFALVALLPLIAGGHGYIYQVSSDGGIDDIMLPLYIACFMYTLLVTSVFYLGLGNRIEHVIGLIESDTFELPEVLLKEIRTFNIWTWVFSFGVFFIDVGLGILDHEFNTFCEFRIKTNDSRYRCGFHTSVWYPFEEDDFLPDWILKVWLTSGEAISLTVYSITITSLVGLLRFIPIRLQCFRREMECFDESNMDIFYNNLGYFSKHYGEILQCAREMNNSVGYVVLICNTLVTVLLSLLLYVAFQHEKLLTTVHNLPWYALTPKQRKDYSLFLGYVTIPIGFKAQPFVLVDYELLYNVTATVYKFLAFLEKTKE